MRVAWYEMQGRAADVLVVGEMPDPTPGPGEVRIRIAASGINPGDIKKRQDAFGLGMSFPRVVPHSDGAGVIDAVGEGVPSSRMGERVWCFGAQSYRAFGTAAACTVVPSQQVIRLPEGVSFEIGACLGIPGITAYRAVHAGGPVAGRSVLVQGGAGGVGSFAVGLARRAGARVIATVQTLEDAEAARRNGAHEVVLTAGRALPEIVADIHQQAVQGIQHIVDVAFDDNIDVDMQVLALGGSIAAYATSNPRPSIPFWNLLFKNARIFLIGSDDFPFETKREAAAALNDLVASGWDGVLVLRTFPLAQIAQAHEAAEQKRGPGRIVIQL